MKISFIYDALYGHIGTIHDHAECFSSLSSVKVDYLPVRNGYGQWLQAPQTGYDWILCHYAIRTPGNAYAPFLESLMRSPLRKALFLQDEYDNVEATRKWMDAICFDVVFTCVPDKSVREVYPSARFGATQFVNVLTGYAPNWAETKTTWKSHAERSIDVGYRGRNLPFRYGRLGQEKRWIGEQFIKRNKTFAVDISSDEKSRIYGPEWIDFLENCRCVLGSESGCNLFDWDGSLIEEEQKYLIKHPAATFEDFERDVICGEEGAILMNQISPRVFEAAATKTALLLLEGEYSGVLKPHEHYFPIQKDFSNWKDLVAFVSNPEVVEAMAERTHRDLISRRKYSYPQFAESVIAVLKANSSAATSPQINAVSLPSAFENDSELTKLHRKLRFAHPFSMTGIQEVSTQLVETYKDGFKLGPEHSAMRPREAFQALIVACCASLIYAIQVGWLQHYRPTLPRIFSVSIFTQRFKTAIALHLEKRHAGLLDQ